MLLLSRRATTGGGALPQAAPDDFTGDGLSGILWRNTNGDAGIWLTGAGTSFTGIEIIRNQDTAVQESMGPIYDRTKEHLGVSDTAIIRMRRRMLDSVRAFTENGAEPLGLGEPLSNIVAVEGMLPRDRPWQDLLATGAPAFR